MRACVRVRPALAAEQASYGERIPGMSEASFAQFEYHACLVDACKREVVVLSEERRIGRPTGNLASQRFGTDDIYGEDCDDDAVYTSAVAPLVEAARAGGVRCIRQVRSVAQAPTIVLRRRRLEPSRARGSGRGGGGG